MKLLYVWVQEYEVFHNREFRFSDEFCFHFHGKTEKDIPILGCYQNKNSVSKLINTQKVELPSFIIGDNGSGKTTLLRLLMKILPYEGTVFPNEDIKVIYILKEYDDNGIYIYTTLDRIKLCKDENVNIKNCEGSVIERMRKDSRNFLAPDVMKKTAIIFHSNIFDRNLYAQKPYAGVKDISFNGRLYSDWEYRSNRTDERKTELKIHLEAEMLRQIKFICDNADDSLNKWIIFNLPSYLKLEFREERSMLRDIYDYCNPELYVDKTDDFYASERLKNMKLEQLQAIFAHICKDIMNRYNENFHEPNEEKFVFLLNKGVLISCIRLIFPSTVGLGTTEQLCKVILSMKNFLYQNEDKSCMKYVRNFVASVAHHDNDSFLEALEKLNALDKEKIKYNSSFDYFYIKTADKGFMVDFYNDYCKTNFYYDYLTFKWSGLSSGEFNLLSMYSRIYSLKEEIQDDDSIIMLIDEADLSYHPEWQQEYVNSMIKFFNKFYGNYEVQLIIATHSPIMLSDSLTKDNVIFLKNKDGENMENMFGANIYDLYRKGMLLKRNYFGIIGEFATEKIQEKIEKLEKWEKEIWNKQSTCYETEIPESELNEMEMFINCIGEPLTQKVMRYKYDKIKMFISYSYGLEKNEEK